MTRNIPSRDLLAAKLVGVQAYHEGADYLHERVLGDGRAVWLMAMGTGNLRLSIGVHGSVFFDDQYCYHDHDAAWRAVLGWDGEGEPEGWYRHMQTGRRRPDGDPEKEYVCP